jgi:DNA-directed RNA polymerase specialized sigma24 family protein
MAAMKVKSLVSVSSRHTDELARFDEREAVALVATIDQRESIETVASLCRDAMSPDAAEGLTDLSPAQIRAALPHLTPIQRVVVTAIELVGSSPQEVARLLDIDVKRVQDIRAFSRAVALQAASDRQTPGTEGEGPRERMARTQLPVPARPTPELTGIPSA